MNTTISTTTQGAQLLARLLRPRVQQLTDLLDAQVQALEPGNDQWAETAEQLTTARQALNACQNAAQGGCA